MNNYTIITGSTSGIGYAMAKFWASNGHNLILVARNLERLIAIKNELLNYQTKILIYQVDLSNIEQVENFCQTIKNEDLVIDTLINNAGIGDYNLFLNTKLNKINEMLDLNIKSLTNMCYYIGNLMKTNHHGLIINVASVGAFVPGPFMACYYASKAYVLSFSEAISYEFKKDNIKVKVLCPGPTKTAFFKKANNEYDLLKKMKAMTPEAIAKITYKKMNNKKTIIIPGFKNRIACFLPRLITRATIIKIMYKLQNKRYR